jgi:MFS family permease
LILGILCDRLASKNAAWPFRLAGGGLAGFFVSMFALCFVKDVNIATALCFPAGLMAGGWVIAMQSALQDLLPAKARATGSAIWGFALAFSGLALGVLFVGFVSDVLSSHYGENSIRIAMAITLLPVVPAAIFLFLAGRTISADRAALIKALE